MAGTSWSDPNTVAGFVKSAPNPVLINYARQRLPHGHPVLLDIGCGAGRNIVALAELGWYAIGTDLSWPMLDAASARRAHRRFDLALAPMDALPIRDRSVDLIVAHGVWNLARSTQELRQALAEAARVAKKGAALFVFTFSRSTLPVSTSPVLGEAFVFTQFSGTPQCFLTEAQLLAELRAVGFEPDPQLPLRELNQRPPGSVGLIGGPVIFEGGFRST